MDNLTHTLVGLALSRAGLNRHSPRASWTLALAANAPDVDVLAALAGPAAYLDAHRHLTHSLALVPVMALLAPAVLRAAWRKPLDWKACYWLSAAGVLSHLLLDWLNLYGIRLLLPFSGTWLRLDLTPVVDPWMLAVLVLASAGPPLSRLVGSEIGEKRGDRRAGRSLARFALAFLVLYTGGRAVLHARAIELLESHLYRGEPPRRTAALPDPINPFRWRGLVDAGGFYSVHAIDLNGRFDPLAGQIFSKESGGDAVRRAAETLPFRSFLRFNQYPVWSIEAGGGHGEVKVRLVDLRFGTPRAPGFTATATVAPDGRVSGAAFSFGTPRPR